MLGRRRRGGSSSKPHEPTSAGAAVTAGNGQGAHVSQFITQLGRLNRNSSASTVTISRCSVRGNWLGSCVLLADEPVTKRLHRLNQRLRLLELQMETLEADVAKASGDSEILEGCS